MDWYGGPTLLEHLETVPVGGDPATEPARFPVQYVIRPQHGEHRDYRGYAGQLASGVLRAGDRVTVLPSGLTSTVAGIDVLGEETGIAFAPQSVTRPAGRRHRRLARRPDRGRPGARVRPRTSTATVCHLNERPLRVGDRVLLKHTTRTVRAVVKDIPYLIDIDTLAHVEAPASLQVNDIGRVVLRTAEPLRAGRYATNRRTGSFLLIDPADGTTLTAGMAGESF